MNRNPKASEIVEIINEKPELKQKARKAFETHHKALGRFIIGFSVSWMLFNVIALFALCYWMDINAINVFVKWIKFSVIGIGNTLFYANGPRGVFLALTTPILLISLGVLVCKYRIPRR